ARWPRGVPEQRGGEALESWLLLRGVLPEMGQTDPGQSRGVHNRWRPSVHGAVVARQGYLESAGVPVPPTAESLPVGPVRPVFAAQVMHGAVVPQPVVAHPHTDRPAWPHMTDVRVDEVEIVGGEQVVVVHPEPDGRSAPSTATHQVISQSLD